MDRQMLWAHLGQLALIRKRLNPHATALRTLISVLIGALNRHCDFNHELAESDFSRSGGQNRIWKLNIPLD